MGYFWGLSFAVLFYFGFPIWWWRYGFWRSAYLLVVCVGAVLIVKFSLLAMGAKEAGESFVVAMLLFIPARAVGGFWVAHRDEVWRRTTRFKRSSRFANS